MVTGGTGVIGVALILALVSHNIEVLVLHNENSRRLENIPTHPLVQLCPCSLDGLSNFKNTSNLSYDVFFHMAWSGTIGEKRDDVYTQQENVKFALDAVGAAKRLGCKVFIGLGSQAEYGVAEEKLRYSTPTNPKSGYGIAKLCAGQLTRKYTLQLGMEHIWVRVLSVYGPYDSPATMIMSTIDKLSKGIIPSLTAGEQIWDYLYSSDAAEALLLLAQNGISGKIYVLGSGEGRPLREYVEEIRNIVAPSAKINFGSVPYGENQVMYLCADISDISRDTGWSPKVNFKKGIESLIRQELEL